MTHQGQVLVVTNLDDPTTDLVVNELHGRGVPVVRFDSGDFPATLSFAAHITPHGIEGSLTTPTRKADLATIRAMYYRRPSGFTFPHLDAQSARFAITQARYGLGGTLAALPDCLYVNHPHRVGDAEFKPAGLSSAVRCGFRVPSTLITSDPVEARKFVGAQPSVIYKPLSTPQYQLNGVGAAVKVAEVSADQLDDSVGGTAHLFQVRIEKQADIRLTVMGERVFAVRIDSDVLDWRTDYANLRYSVVATPEDVEKSVRAYLDHFGLVFGAFDFAVDQGGAWWFLECNPSGQWAWMEPETGLPMTSAMTDLLERKTQ